MLFGSDRNLKLEADFDKNFLHIPQGTFNFGDIFIPTSSNQIPTLPIWVANATIFQNAAKFSFSPDTFAHYKVTSYYHDGQWHTIKGKFSDADYAAKVPMSLALTASASYPVATLPLTLKSSACETKQCYLQLLDGGIVDNLGVISAYNLLKQDSAPIKVLIVIDAFRGLSNPFSQSYDEPGLFMMVSRLLNMDSDANHETIKSNADSVVKATLCRQGASNVIVIYLSLNDYQQARHIGTTMSMTAADQALLIKIGQDLVAKNQQLKTFIKQLNNNNVKIGSCSASSWL